MNEPQPLAPPSPVAGLNAQVGLIGQRQEQLAHVVAELGGSVSDFDQLRTYVEQIASILANLAKEVGAHDLNGVERRLDDMGRVALEVETLRQETREIAAIVGGQVQRRANAPVPWWPDLPAGPEREAAVQNLGLWVDEVLRARHPEAYNELGTCWFQHPDILELTALRAAWFAAYRDPEASHRPGARPWSPRRAGSRSPSPSSPGSRPKIRRLPLRRLPPRCRRHWWSRARSSHPGGLSGQASPCARANRTALFRLAERPATRSPSMPSPMPCC